MSHATPPTIVATNLERSGGHELEAVIGHRMPKTYGMWINQYAQHAASKDGRVVLAHLMEKRCDLRVFDSVQPRDAERTGDLPSGAAASHSSDPLAFFKSMREADSQVGRWMLRVDEPMAQAALPILSHVDRWTIVAAADVHTCVGLYVLVKALRHAEKFRLFRRVGIFIVGSDEREARACVTSANLLTTSLLRTPLEWVGCLPRPQSPHSSVLGGFDLTTRQWPDVVTRLKQLSRRHQSAAAPSLRLVSGQTKENA